MIDQNFLVHGIRQKHFLLENFRNILYFLGRDHLHPFFQWLPFSEGDKKVVSANLIKSLHFLKPLLHSDELHRLWGDEFADALAAEGVVILDLIFYYFRVGDNLHVIMVILMLSNHVNELVCCQFFLSHHLEECGDLCVINGIIRFLCIFFWDRWRNGFELGFFRWRLPSGSWHIRNLFLALFVGTSKRVTSAGPPGWNQADIIIFLHAHLFGWSNFGKQIELGLLLLFLEGFLASLLKMKDCIHRKVTWYHPNFSWQVFQQFEYS